MCEFCLQNGCPRPFWMSENHFRLHFWPFQINTQNFFYKMAAVGHLGCPKFTLDHISGYFRSIQIYVLFFTKWLPVAILDVRKSFRSHFWPFHIDTQLYLFLKFLTKWLPSAILDVRNSLWITFLAILDQYRFFFFFFFFTKWLPVAILDVRKSLSISFLSISHRYTTFIFLEFFDKMADVGHFGCQNFTFDRISGHFRTIGLFGFPKFTFDRNSGHFRSIQNFVFPVAILDVRKSLWITFLAISD